ncbi:MAG TPA: hypothetical protein VK697_03750 [Methylomirabilota bacterium]|jgi:hypothetical protein|nr:hypothetical protein [Methylomirabilota bacterium]
MKDRPGRVPQLGEVGQDLDPNVTAKPMDAANEGDDEALRGNGRDGRARRRGSWRSVPCA